MNQDEEHLRLLVIFHYVVAGISALFACFPLIYVALGTFFIVAEPAQGANAPPPAAFGWMFVFIGTFFSLIGWTFASCVFAAGRCLARRRRHLLCQVVAGFECIFMPFGTALGVFTIVVLQRESVRALFAHSEAAGRTLSATP